MELFLSISLALTIIALIGSIIWGRGKTVRLQTQLEAKEKNHTDVARQCEELRQQHDHMNKEITEKAAHIAALKTELKNEQEQAKEKIKLLQKTSEDISEDMQNKFKNLSQSILEEKGRKFDEENKKLLDPLKADIEKFRRRVDEIHTEDTKERSALQRQIKDLQSNAKEYGESADNLARVLKGDSKTQGDWGEITLANLLEKSGLREGEEYETQTSLRNEDGNLLRPDVIIKLPDNKHLIIDSKVSLRDFQDATIVEDPHQQQQALASHVKAVKNHIKTLSDKHYPNVKELNAPDFVFMFMPIEPAFFAALKKEPDLFSDAYDKKIILCAPTTLMATLRTVERIWQLERQNRNAEEIARQGGVLYDKFVSFVENIEKVGDALSKAQKSYDNAYKQLSTGSGNLIKKANKLRDLGANPKKARLPEPDTLLEKTPADDE